MGKHERTVQLLENGDDTAELSAVFETDDTKTESCQQGKLLGVVSSGRSATELVVLGKGAKTKSLQHDKSALVDLCCRLNIGIALVLIVGTEPFASED